MLNLLKTRAALPLILVIGLMAMTARPVTDPDVWWHLRTGQLIVQTHHVFHADPYSFTRAGQPWVNHEWLAEVFMFLIYRSLGYGGLIVCFAAIITMAFFLLYVRCEGRPYLAALTIAWCAAASSSTWGIRPQMISFLLASIFLLILEKGAQKPRLLWWLPLLTILWVNLHAGYALGLSLIALYLTGTLLNLMFGNEGWQAAAAYVKQLSIILAVSAGLVPLNPNGVRMYLYPWQTLSSRAMQQYIQEWSSPNFHQGLYLPFLFLILALVAAVATSLKRLRPLDLLLLGVTLYAALRSVRHIPIFVLVAAPILSRLLQALIHQWFAQTKLEKTSPFKLGFNAVLIVGVLVFTVIRLDLLVRKQSVLESKSFPAAAVSFLAKNHPPAPLFNHYNWGGYLIWKLYPQYRVFVDGRADVYGDAFLHRLADVYYIRSNWKSDFASDKACTVMLPPDAPLVAALREQQDWNQVYADNQAVLLVRKSGCPAASMEDAHSYN